MTSPQPLANHKPPPLSFEPEARPRNHLGLNFQEGQLKKRIHLFEGLSNENGSAQGENGGGEGSDRLRCRQPKVISPDQKRWTQLDVTSEEPGGRPEISRLRAGQQTMHSGCNRGPVSPGPKPVAQPRRFADVKSVVIIRAANGNGKTSATNSVTNVKPPKPRATPTATDRKTSQPLPSPMSATNHRPSQPLLSASATNGRPPQTIVSPAANPQRPTFLIPPSVDGIPSQPMSRQRSKGGSRKQRDENVRNSVFALVSAFETTKSTAPAVVERHSQMLTVPEGERDRRKSESSSTEEEQQQPRLFLSIPKAGRERTNSESSGNGSSSSVQKRVSRALKPPVPQNRVSRSMDSLVQEFETTAFELSRESSRSRSPRSPRSPHSPESPENPLSPTSFPEKPQRTFAQDIYNQRKVEDTIRKAAEELRRKPSMTRISNSQQLNKESRDLSAGDYYRDGRVPKGVSRTFGSDETIKESTLPHKYEVLENFGPVSRNCNHNGGVNGLEDNQVSISAHLYDHIPSEEAFDPVVTNNNNQSSFLDKLKPSKGRKHRIPSSSGPSYPPPPPPPPSKAPSNNLPPTALLPPPKTAPLPQQSAPLPSKSALLPPPRDTLKLLPSAPSPPPRDTSRTSGFINGNIADERDRLLSPPSADFYGSHSPGSKRRMTDGALIQSLLPRMRRREGARGPTPSSPLILGEYAEPVRIQRWLSDEMLAPSPVLDNQGYSVPGSHLLMHKASTLMPKSSARLVIEQRPHLNTISQPILRRDRPPNAHDHLVVGRSKDKSKKAGGEDEPAASTRGEGVPGLEVQKEGFRKRSKLLTMRRKINDAFRRKHHHQKTEEDRISVTSEGSDSEVNDQVKRKRLTYVRAMRLRSSVYCTVQPLLAMQYSKLYEYAVIVSLQMDEETRRYEPYEIRRFPHEVSDSQSDKLRAIPQFCFPDAFKWAPVDKYNSESFTFVLTSSDGSRLYGYNRRILPPGKGPRLPEVVCVMSPIGCYPIYNQLLDEVENRRKTSISAVENLLKLAYDCPFPRPGSHTKVVTPPTSRRKNLNSMVTEHKPLFLQRPQDQRLEHVDFDTLFNCLSATRIIQIFASLLLERRVIMCSGKLSKLSRCSQALAGLLYPFAWQHVYVPVLPEKLIDMCCSPTPYIMGMLSLCIPRLEELPLEEVLVVDLDARDFYTVIGDEETILPKKLSAALERALKVCSMSSWEGADTDDELSEDHESKNSAISEAFIRFFVETVGHYSNHFTQQYDGSQKFDRDGFVKAHSSKSTRTFLEVFSETQMFSLFIQEKEAESEGISQGLFERRVKEYENETKSNSKNISAKMKKIGKAVKEIKESAGFKLAESAKGVQKRVKQNLDDKI